MIKNRIKKILFSEYTLSFIFLFLIISSLFIVNNSLYFRNLGDATPEFTWYPASLLIKNLFSEGFSFRWSPLFGLGLPFLADPMLGGILPFRFFLMVNPDFYVVLILLTAGYFTYLFARNIDIGKFGSLLAASCFMLNAYFIQYMNHSQLEADSFLPIHLLLFYLAVKKKNFSFTVLAGISLGLSILVMSPESTFYAMFVVIVYILGLLLSDKFREIKEFSGGLQFILIAGILGILITSFQLLPFMEYFFGHAFLGHVQRGFIHNRLKDLFSMISPEFYFKFSWVYTPYVGVRGLIFFFFMGLWATIYKPNRHAMLFGFGLFLLVGICYGYLNKLFNYFPLARVMANEKHPIPAIAFCIAIIGGFGFDYLLKHIPNKVGKTVVVILVMCGIVFELLLYYRVHFSRSMFSKISLRKIPAHVEFLKKDKEIYRIYANPRDGFKQGNIYSHLRGNRIEIFNINNISYDSIYFPHRYHKYVVDLLEGESSRTHNIINKIESFRSPLFNLLNVKYIAGQYLPDLEKSTNGQYYLVFDREEGIGPKGDPVNLKIYKNNNVLPRAFMVYSTETLNTEELIFNRLKDPNYNPRETIIIEEKLPSELGSINITDKDITNSVTITDYKPKEVDINVETSNDGFLFLGDMYFPGWHVYVDGNVDKIYRANYLFRGVFLKKGKHTIKFVYRPVSFKLGVYITIATLFLSLILVLYQKGLLIKNIMRVLVGLGLIFITVNLVIFYQDYRKNLDPLYIKEEPKEEPFVHTNTFADTRIENDG